MTADFTAMLVGGILFALTTVAFFWWRFGVANTLAFVIVSGGFSAVMDYISSFVVRNYEYPGQSALWVATFIFFGWIGTCATCLLLAEGIVVRSHQDMFTERRLWLVVPLLTAGHRRRVRLVSRPHRRQGRVLGVVRGRYRLLRYPASQLCWLVCPHVPCTAGLDAYCP